MKRWYITLAPSLLPLILAVAWAAHAARPTLAWAGAALAALALPARLGGYYLFPTARTPATPVGLLLTCAVGLVLVGAGGVRGDAIALPLTLALACLANVGLYVLWYAPLQREAGVLAVGRPLPPFEVATLDGATHDARTLCDRPTVWIFFRGNWCPLCGAQIRETVRAWKAIEARGARVALVSPQLQEHTAALARRLGVRFEFLVDRGGRAARALGILHPGALPAGFEVFGYDVDLVLPTVVVTDREGVVRYLHATESYRDRPAPEDWLTTLDDLARREGAERSSPPA